MPKKIDAMFMFRKSVRQVMDQQDLTITELAERVGTSRSGMSCILSGKDGVTIERADRIAKALDVKLSDLISGKIPQLA